MFFQKRILNNHYKNKTGIIGSGFGLYGYLPAIAGDKNNSIVLLEKYRQKFNSRKELTEFNEVISWAGDEASLYESVDNLVVCVSPEGQFEVVKQVIGYPNIAHLALEKPLAVDPEKSGRLLNDLIESGKYYRIGYNFQYTGWGKELLSALSNDVPCHINIDWHFMAHHYAKNLENWKRYSDSGGGVIRFYGIHLIALLGHVKECRIVSSSSTGYSGNDVYEWSAQLQVNSIHTLAVNVNSAAAETKFIVSTGGEGVNNEIKLNDPFDEYISAAANQDRRVGVIKPVLNSLMQDEQQKY